MIGGLLRISRPLNAGIAFLSILAAGMIAGTGIEKVIAILPAAVFGTLIGTAGNVFNDLLDIDIDRVNKPKRPLVEGSVTRPAAVGWGTACAVAGAAGSSLYGAETFAIACAALAVLAVYNLSLKRIPLLGNAVVACLTGAAFLYGSSAAGDIVRGSVPALLAAGFNLPRELLKDIEDVEGDKQCGVSTFPVRFGVRLSRDLAVALLLCLLVGTSVPFFLGYYSAAYLLVVVAGIAPVIVLQIVRLSRSPTPESAGRAAVALKYDMVVGVAAVVAGVYF
ncbi:MAG: geranylgeranylglycerol-phosphate geranylgeranyltransferase [Bacteroidota bacterium]|nr:geranylgeranylglycerol-phosphate geranylgeranyltransferase [Bacteroidota bacterium]